MLELNRSQQRPGLVEIGVVGPRPFRFEALASAAIMVLLAFLITMNTLAVVLRKRLERRW